MLIIPFIIFILACKTRAKLVTHCKKDIVSVYNPLHAWFVTVANIFSFYVVN